LIFFLALIYNECLKWVCVFNANRAVHRQCEVKRLLQAGLRISMLISKVTSPALETPVNSHALLHQQTVPRKSNYPLNN
jgi:hypothetical protein